MVLLHELRRRARHIAPQVFFACLLGYFVYHGVQGDRGLIAWARMQEELERLDARQERLAGTRAHWEHRVGLLRPDRIDPDMLDEQARLLLNLGRENEFVIFLKSMDR